MAKIALLISMPNLSFFRSRRNIMIAIAAIVVLGGIAFAVTRPPKVVEVAERPEPPAVPVRVRLASDSFESTESVTYPGIVSAENEATIIAKANGTASAVSVNVGDTVQLGQPLAKIDDVTSRGTSASNQFNAGQVKQAEIAVQQALNSLQLARNGYTTTLQSSNRDVTQAEIMVSQSTSAQQNVQKTAAENLKSAELAYETSKIATEQARIAYENRKKISDQSVEDLKKNANVTITSAADTSESTIASLNAVTGVEVEQGKGGTVIYHEQLGLLDSTAMPKANLSYKAAIAALKAYKENTDTTQAGRLAAATNLAAKTKTLADDVRYLLEKTFATAALPESTLATIRAQATAAQAQMNGVVALLNETSQALNNVALNNDTALDAMQKAYEIAQQQERSAAQNVENLKAGNVSQTDQATYAAQSAQNQLAATRIRVDGQVSSSASQVSLAEIQYNNAVLNLQNLVDAHQAISPLTGVVIKKSVSNGDTVSQGQVLAVVGTPDQLKTTFFIDQESLPMIALGLEVRLVAMDHTSASGTIVSIAPQADPVTRRYEVEVRPQLVAGVSFPLGSIVDIEVPLRKLAGQGNILVPLVAVDVTPNGDFLTLMKDDKAERVPVTIVRVLGEVLEVKAPITPETVIVVDGARLATPGARLTVIQ
jgi:multidrug efflux pump subunit AcrA (membrane-fusion protein)